MLEGNTLLQAATQAGLVLNTPCGGAGTCGKCRIQVATNAGNPSEADILNFSATQLKEGWRLACQTVVQQETVAYVPEQSCFTGRHQIVTESQTPTVTDLSPALRKIYVELPKPSMQDNDADVLRLEAAIDKFEIDLPLLRRLPSRLRHQEYKGTAVLAGHDLIDFEPGNTTDQCYGVAFDIGTTTLAASLHNLVNGDELAMTSQMNPQVAFGDDVLSRIQHASLSADNLEDLGHSVKTAVTEMILDLCEQASISPHMIYEAVFAGNTTMEHLLCGIDPAPLGQSPFVPAHARGLWLGARDLEMPINPHGRVYVFPLIGGFVGGDTVAGLLATNIHDNQGTVLMIDIGTNGEIVLARNGKIWAASTAAGPAFEGARIRCGMRATTGAIEKIVLNEDVHCSVIGNVSPVGLCGSALIDLAAVLRKVGMISSTGQLLPVNQLPNTAGAMQHRVSENSEGQLEFLIAHANQGSADGRIVLTQRDIRELQLAVGAIRAGIKIMLKQAGIKAEAIDQVFIAGGFGSFIRRDNAQAIGLLPIEIDLNRISYVGNVSLAGSKLALLSSRARQQAETSARQAKHLELSLDLEFQMEFADAMIFPDLP
ncbi:MAG: ASKHA domain-containing protein [Phycisphaerae bacterium]|nr:ASKHA domain-containing protein [Phycisphaerae bacterium]